MSHEHDRVLILDFGSQFTQLIARRIREESVYCEIHPADAVPRVDPGVESRKAVILSGGPNSVYDDDVAEDGCRSSSESGIPVLGICYGMQLIAQIEGADVDARAP